MKILLRVGAVLAIIAAIGQFALVSHGGHLTHNDQLIWLAIASVFALVTLITSLTGN